MLRIKVKKGDINRALKEYRSKVIKTRQMREVNDRKEYTKPSEERRRVIQKAKYRDSKNRDEEK